MLVLQTHGLTGTSVRETGPMRRTNRIEGDGARVSDAEVWIIMNNIQHSFRVRI